MHASLEPASNVTEDRELQDRKQYWCSTSTEQGIQMEESPEQFSKALIPNRETVEPDSKMTLEIARQSEKQATSTSSMPFKMTTSDASPKYRLIEMPSKSRRKDPKILR
jgi:hypothetical protein